MENINNTSWKKGLGKILVFVRNSEKHPLTIFSKRFFENHEENISNKNLLIEKYLRVSSIKNLQDFS